ncbi:MAG: cupin domain-containing protein [Pseudomonadota bacterium]
MGELVGVTRVAHSDRSGTGLVAWDPLDPALLVSGTPVQRGWLCDENTETGYMAGVWDCTAFVDQPGPYPVDEFMLLLEGSVVMALPDGAKITVEAGQAFVIPKGFRCQWTMPDYVRKVFMIVDDPVTEGAENPSLDRITVPDWTCIGAEGPVGAQNTWFLNSTGRMAVSVAQLASGRTASAAAPTHELIHVLDGSLTLSGEGGALSIGPGETGYIRAGSVLGRETTGPTSTLTATYAP